MPLWICHWCLKSIEYNAMSSLRHRPAGRKLYAGGFACVICICANNFWYWNELKCFSFQVTDHSGTIIIHCGVCGFCHQHQARVGYIFGNFAVGTYLLPSQPKAGRVCESNIKNIHCTKHFIICVLCRYLFTTHKTKFQYHPSLSIIVSLFMPSLTHNRIYLTFRSRDKVSISR